jgi:hypothetical protein
MADLRGFKRCLLFPVLLDKDWRLLEYFNRVAMPV